jgi:hypothetical protein
MSFARACNGLGIRPRAKTSFGRTVRNVISLFCSSAWGRCVVFALGMEARPVVRLSIASSMWGASGRVRGAAGGRPEMSPACQISSASSMWGASGRVRGAAGGRPEMSPACQISSVSSMWGASGRVRGAAGGRPEMSPACQISSASSMWGASVGAGRAVRSALRLLERG